MYFFHVIPAKIVSNTKIFWHNNTSVLTDFFSWPDANWIILICLEFRLDNLCMLELDVAKLKLNL